ncbi:MAG: glycerol-3-phosphate dehydrogenase, partial [Silicimonas sp.]|nr:glycerol-3-phosphate dehydrogenase [Silicimonas sp.]
KITTYRKLAEAALEKIDGALDRMTNEWTCRIPLPGGDFPVRDVAKQRATLQAKLPFLDAKVVHRLFRQYGTQAESIFESATSLDHCGANLGHGVTGREVDWAIENEWVCTADDFLWRRSKLGLHFSPDEVANLEDYIAGKLAA